ncbi:uncharacterized protein ACIB01_012535 [Guaruba guarouba]
MPVGKEANARSQPAEGSPSLRRRRQVAHRQPEEAPQGSSRQMSSHHRITLPLVPYPERFRPVISQQAQVGIPGETRPNAFPTPGDTEEQVGGAGGSKLSPPCRAPQAAHACRVLWEVAMDCGWPVPLSSRLWEQEAASRLWG